jgi:hypothetical protein
VAKAQKEKSQTRQEKTPEREESQEVKSIRSG